MTENTSISLRHLVLTLPRSNVGPKNMTENTSISLRHLVQTLPRSNVGPNI